MLRVTDNMIFTALNQSVMVNKERQILAQQASTRAMEGTADPRDPLAVSRVNVLESTLTRLETMGRVASVAEQELSVTESAIAESAQIASRVQELMLSAANETLSASDRLAISYEVTELKEQLLSLANTQVSGSFIFGGYKTGTEPFTAAGVYQGDQGQRTVEVAPGLTAKMNLPGDQVFAPTGGVNIFDVLSDFETALTNNDADAIQDSITDIATAHKQLINAQSSAGINLKTVLSAKDLRAEIEQNVLQQKEAVVDADPHEAFTDFTQTQYGLQAALAQAQKIISSLDSGLR